MFFLVTKTPTTRNGVIKPETDFTQQWGRPDPYYPPISTSVAQNTNQIVVNPMMNEKRTPHNYATYSSINNDNNNNNKDYGKLIDGKLFSYFLIRIF